VFDFKAIRDRLDQLGERQSFLRPTGAARVLVVDDNEVNVELLVAMLASEHYLVSAAYDGLQALAQIETEKPDIILLDIMMPGLDGSPMTSKAAVAKLGSHWTLRWRGQSRANSSQLKNSLLAGKIQGISFDPGSAARQRQQKEASNQCLTSQFPTHPNREFFAA